MPSRSERRQQRRATEYPKDAGRQGIAELSIAEEAGPAVDQGIRRRLRREVNELRDALDSGVFDSEPRIIEAMTKEGLQTELTYWAGALGTDHEFVKALQAAISDESQKPTALAEYAKYWCEGSEQNEEFCKQVRLYGDPSVNGDALFDWLCA
ncbi:MAG: hypothetical protein AAF541_22785 [Pseudomonadota bacterium]